MSLIEVVRDTVRDPLKGQSNMEKKGTSGRTKRQIFWILGQRGGDQGQRGGAPRYSALRETLPPSASLVFLPMFSVYTFLFLCPSKLCLCPLLLPSPPPPPPPKKKILLFPVYLKIQHHFLWSSKKDVLFCSPEPKAHGWANNSLPVTPASLRPSTFSNIFSETTGPIELKFHRETP